MAFNPEDFVFNKIELPEDNPTILEYDAIAKYVIVRTTDSIGEHTHEACQLSESLNNNLLEGLPEKFSNRNDRLILFYIRENGKYRLEKEKLKYNFKTKESDWIRYVYDSLSLDEAKEIFEAIKTAVWLQNELNEEELRQNTIELAKKEVYLNRDYAKKKLQEQTLLRNSDWRVLDDAPQTFEGEKELWTKWRSEIRQIVKSPRKFETELDYLKYSEAFKWPINPEQYYDLDNTMSVPYLSDDKHWISTFSTVELTREKEDKLTAIINARIAEVKDRKENNQLGIDLQMMHLLQRYHLLDNDLGDVKIVEAE